MKFAAAFVIVGLAQIAVLIAAPSSLHDLDDALMWALAVPCVEAVLRLGDSLLAGSAAAPEGGKR